MRVRLLFFATLKDIVGSRELSVDIPQGSTIDDLLSHLEIGYPRIRDYRSIVLTALNEEYADRTARIADGDEVAIFPPVSGGEVAEESRVIRRTGERYEITRGPIDAQAISRQMLRPADGAVCVFEGVVRDHSKGKRTLHLEYEGYEAMALKKLEEIGAFLLQAWEIGTVAIVHRLGHMEIGETSVAVIVTSSHRRAAFEACQYGIDKLKKVVPIWKKEVFEDGEVWVEGQT